MNIDYGLHYKKSEKNIKKKYEQKRTLDMIKNHLKECSNFDELLTHPISIMYGIEALKYELSSYYSFNLCKNKGTVRLIFSVNILLNIVYLEYISIDHYNDFKSLIRK